VFNLHAAPISSPEEVISKITEDILLEIKNDPVLSSGNLDRINELVNQKVMPIVDFKRMTSLAVGRKWRLADDNQKQALMDAFRKLLLLSYSGAIRYAEKATIKILPQRGEKEENNVVVKTRVTVPGKQSISIDYRMQKTISGWKIYDLNVLGLWLVENYRSQFSQIVNSNGIDGLIIAIVKKNKQIMQTK
jgi:phospholipid transport system substrate-binding protein